VSFNFTNNVTGGNAQINQGQTVNATQTNYGGANNATEVIEQVEREFNSLAEEQSKTVESDPDAERHEYTDPAPVFEELKLCAAEPEPEPEVVESAMLKFKRMISERGPQIGKALCNGVVAGLQATVATHPVVVAVTSFLKTFND
jgi:hypothetical protein